MKRFNPSAASSLSLLPLSLIMFALGYWQLERLSAKRELVTEFDSAPTSTLAEALEHSDQFARISAGGRFDTRRHILLDNQVYQGRAGVHVFTPFRTVDGGWILVNRGWKPLGADRSLPDIWTPSVPVGIKGILAQPPKQFDKLGDPDVLGQVNGPQIVTYFDAAAIGQALGMDLPEWIVLLDGQDPNGFEGRDWKPLAMEPERHGAYALQWFSLAIAALVFWAVLGVTRARTKR